MVLLRLKHSSVLNFFMKLLFKRMKSVLAVMSGVAEKNGTVLIPEP